MFVNLSYCEAHCFCVNIMLFLNCLSFSHYVPQMWLCLLSPPHPGMQAAGQIQCSQLCTLPVRQRPQGPLLMRHSPPAPLRHPPPAPPSPAVTQVLGEGWEEGYRAGATALNACWRPLVVHLRTTTTLMGPAGPELWRTSTLSTKWPMTGFSRVISGQDVKQEVVTWDTAVSQNAPDHWITRYFVFTDQVEREGLRWNVTLDLDRKHAEKVYKARGSHSVESYSFASTLLITSCSPLPTVP